MKRPTNRAAAVTSTAAIVAEVIDRQRLPIKVPRGIRLSPDAVRLFHAIINAKPRRTWTPLLVVVAAQAARITDEASEAFLVSGGGKAATRARGELVREELKLLRMLGITGCRRVVAPRVPEVADSDLLAG